MDIAYPGFGRIVIEGKRFDGDVIIERGETRPRDKGPSRAVKSPGAHTPLSALEDLPWSGKQLVVGTGYSGRLPVLQAVIDEAGSRGVELVLAPTKQACAMLQDVDPSEVNAVLHVTC